MEAVLPRIKTKRRKRKRRPMTKLERTALFGLLWCGLLAIPVNVYSCISSLNSDTLLHHFSAVMGFGCAWLCAYLIQRRFWPVVHNYIKNGYLDE